MFGEHLRWSDGYKEELSKVERINHWYHQALEEIRGNESTFLGDVININNPKEVIAFLYLKYKDFESFHERL